MIRSLEKSPLIIPRMYWEYSQPDFTFSYTMPLIDAESAQRLKRSARPMEVGVPKHDSIIDTLEGLVEENSGGAITLSRNDSDLRLSFALTPLPAYDPVDQNVKLFVEKQKLKNASRHPFLRDRSELYLRLAKISDVQYQFGIDPGIFNTSRALPPARISFVPDYGRLSPQVVATNSFREAQAAIIEAKRTTEVCKEALDFMIQSDVEFKPDRISGLTFWQDNIFHLPGGCVCYGNRSEGIKAVDKESFTMRLQSGDAYIAGIHNWGEGIETQLAMVIVGAINRISREEHFNRLPSQI